MKTFCAVDSAALVRLINDARKRIVLIAPGLELPVATAVAKRLCESDRPDVTVILDADEDVCRIGFGDEKTLPLLYGLAGKGHLAFRSQPGLRLGVLLADEQMLVWSPTPRSVEAPPNSQPTVSEKLDRRSPVAPNGLMLGGDPRKEIALAIAPGESSEQSINNAGIGSAAITKGQIDETLNALKSNPPIPVDLARVTRVFSTKLQFVEFKVTGSKLSKSQLTIPNSLLNADATEDLRNLLDSKLLAFGDLRLEEVDVPAFTNGLMAYDATGKQVTEKVTEASLERKRHEIERRFIYDAMGFGRLIERSEIPEFKKCVAAYEVQLCAHATGVRALLAEQTRKILDDAIDLVMARASKRTLEGKTNDAENTTQEKLRERFTAGINRAAGQTPVVKLVFKDVTYEQTQNKEFRDRMNKALPAKVRKRLGAWSEHFDAARQRATGTVEI